MAQSTSSTATSSINKTTVIDSVAAGLGSLVWWDMSDTAIRPRDLRHILKSEGEDPDVVPDIKPIGALRQAVRQFHEGAGNADRYRAEVVAADDQSALVGLLRRVQVSEKEVAWEQICRAEFTVGKGWDQIPDVPQMQRLIDQITNCQQYLDHSWIRPNLIKVRLEKWSAFGLRRQGGVYYVPDAYKAQVDTLARIVSQIGTSMLYVAHVSGTAASKRSLGTSAKVHLSGLVSNLKDQIRDWGESEVQVRSSTIGNAIIELKALNDKATFYADLLDMEKDALMAEMTDAKADLERMLEEVGLNTEERSVPTPHKGTITKLQTVIDNGIAQGNGSILCKPEAFEAANLGLSRWTKHARFWKGDTYQMQAAKMAGYHGAWSKPLGGVLFTKIEHEDQAAAS